MEEPQTCAVLTYKKILTCTVKSPSVLQGHINREHSFWSATYKTCSYEVRNTQASRKELLVLEAGRQKDDKSKKSITLVQSTMLDAATGKSG